MDSRFSDQYAEIGDLKLHYVSGGEGPPVLLIPGWLQTWYAWRSVMPALADQGFRVIAVDPRGMGHSSRTAAGYDTGQLARDLHSLMQQLGHQRYSVVGHDIGMWIGYAMAADHSAAVERVALIEGGIPGLLKPSPEVLMPQAQSAFFWQFMFNQQPDLPELLIQGRERAFMSYLFDKWAYRPERIALDVYAETYAVPGGIRSQMEYYRAFPETMRQDEQRAKRKLTMPVLVLGGDHGVRDLPQTMLRPVATQVRGRVLPGCGHFAPEECPEALLTDLLPFLQEGRR
ncbi:MAG TPA: alpha/beta hydrolase [Steroidobacter sp.]|uniref:alpha/beta fold hydrolase n=1 Tax=Steroidobacter sp. TaxID=1978227 RepID=UPI002ED77E97